MIDLFSPLQQEARRENLAAYQTYLLDRDGELDMETMTLKRREQNMARYAKPLARIRDMDREVFDKQYVSFDKKIETSPETLLLLSLVKVNAAESFGVSSGYERVLRRALKNNDTLELMLMTEETYHTRILLSSAVLYGIEVTTPFKPPAALRAMIGTIVSAPEFISRPLTLASEIVGTLLFLHLLEKCREVLRHDPELRDSVEERICEILVDEIGHISFNRMSLGKAGLAQARLLIPVVPMVLSIVAPEVAALGVASAVSDHELGSLSPTRLPSHVRRAAFIC
jgi:hypothetical protein